MPTEYARDKAGGGFEELRLYAVVVLLCSLPTFCTLALFSQVGTSLSTYHMEILHALTPQPMLFGVVPVAWIVFVLAGIGTLCLWATSKDERWGTKRWWAAWMVTFLLAAAFAIISMPQRPFVAVAFLTATGPVLLYPVRVLCYMHVSGASWFQALWTTLAALSILCCLLWQMWLVTGFEGREKWTDWPADVRQLVRSHTITWKAAFVSWCAPLAMSFELGLMALLCLIRKWHVQSQEYRTAGLEDGLVSQHEAVVIFATKQLVIWLVALVMIVWMSAAAVATGELQHNQPREDLRDEVIMLAFWVFCGLTLWGIDMIGVKKAESAMRESKAYAQARNAFESDWVRAGCLLVLALPMAICASIDIVRRRLQPEGFQPLLGFTAKWRWTSVYVKAIQIGLGYIMLVVGVGKFFTIFLSFVNDRLSSWPLFTVSLMMFTISFLCFLFPPAPGLPIYMVLGIVVTHSALRQGWSFVGAITWATTVAYVMKLAFTVAAMKWIGVPLSSNEYVMHLVGVHKPTMRAIEQILKTPQITIAKIALLVGGPDWPVAVLCGMLGLPVVQVLICISPVLVQSVFPAVLAGGLLLTEHGSNRGLADTSLAIAAALQVGAVIVMTYYLEEVLEQLDDDEKKRDDPDESTLEIQQRNKKLEALDEAEARVDRMYWREMSWDDLPSWVRWDLISGFVLMFLSVALLAGPWRGILGQHMRCFKEFDLMSTIEEDLNGNVWSIVEPLGWVAITLSVMAGVNLAVFRAYAEQAIRKHSAVDPGAIAEEEGEPLIH
mmetsp:Transcript_17887/g.32452  ORF Transcript_17887/g.32452 Transcript_17887/m.32452 type:complete len:778 (+) Transcript_17887:123-2456(+)